MKASSNTVSNAAIASALNAVKEYGSVSAAARALGIARSTLRGRIDMAGHRDLSAPDADDAVYDDSELRSENIRIRALLEQQAEALAAARAPRVPIPVTRAQRKRGHIQVVIPDVHGSLMDKAAVGAMFSDIEQVRPDSFVQLGDLCECGGFLAQHHALGYVAEIEQMSYYDDMQAASQFLDQLQALVPGGGFILEGNHEARVEKWCVTQTLRHAKDAAYLRSLVAPEVLLQLDKRGITYYRYGETHGDTDVPGAVRDRGCWFTHGYSTAKHAAWQHLLQGGGNVIYGHTHRADYSVGRTVAHGLSAAWCPGTLSKMQPMWRHNSPTGWTHGYLLRIIADDGTFQVIQVPIVRGRSCLGAALECLSL